MQRGVNIAATTMVCLLVLVCGALTAELARPGLQTGLAGYWSALLVAHRALGALAVAGLAMALGLILGVRWQVVFGAVLGGAVLVALVVGGIMFPRLVEEFGTNALYVLQVRGEWALMVAVALPAALLWITCAIVVWRGGRHGRALLGALAGAIFWAEIVRLSGVLVPVPIDILPAITGGWVYPASFGYMAFAPLPGLVAVHAALVWQPRIRVWISWLVQVLLGLIGGVWLLSVTMFERFSIPLASPDYPRMLSTWPTIAAIAVATLLGVLGLYVLACWLRRTPNTSQ